MLDYTVPQLILWHDLVKGQSLEEFLMHLDSYLF